MRVRTPTALVDSGIAQAVLSDAAYELFAKMPPGDRAHGLCVLAALRREGEVSPHVEQAALLHDVGKMNGGLTAVHRALIVLLDRANSRWLDRLAIAAPESWRYPFYVHLCHAELGALHCEWAGCAPVAVKLVRYHESDPREIGDPDLRQYLVALRRADDQC